VRASATSRSTVWVHAWVHGTQGGELLELHDDPARSTFWVLNPLDPGVSPDGTSFLV
jgi:hypothetical protein